MDADRRLAMAKRLLKVRENQHVLHQLHVAQASRIVEAAHMRMEALNAALTHESMGAGAYGEVLHQQSRSGHVRLAQAREVKILKEADLRSMSHKLEQSQRLMQRYDGLVQVEAERNALDDIIDQIAQRPDTSLDPA